MTPLKTKADAEALVNQEGIEYVSVRFTDLIGVQQHFTVPASEFLKDAFDEGMPFDGSSIEGFQAINESDMKLVPDIETAFVDPFRKHKTLDVAFSIVDPLTDEPYSRDPRQVAAKAEAYLKSTGVADTASFAPEAEFFIFDKVRFGNDMRGSFYEVDSIEAPWNSGLDVEEDGTPNIGFKNRVKRGYFPVPPADHTQDLRDDMVANLQKVGLILERAHHEVAGAGQQEINYRFNSLQHAGDDFTNPSLNSYHRLVPGFEAPVNLVYSARNRSAAIRIPLAGTSPAAKRIEFRAPDPSCNPFLAFSAQLMAGLDGILNHIEPPEPVDKDLYELPPEEHAGIKQVPSSLAEALDALEEDHDFLTAGDVFTEDLIETWIDLKRGEIDQARLQPTPLEYELYFHI